MSSSQQFNESEVRPMGSGFKNQEGYPHFYKWGYFNLAGRLPLTEYKVCDILIGPSGTTSHFSM